MQSMRRSILATWLIALWLPFTPGCGHDAAEGHGHDHASSQSAEGDDHVHADGDADHVHSDGDADHGHDHVHLPKFGGMLVVLAAEYANVEVLLDESTGQLDFWALDAHAENTVRLTQPYVPLTVHHANGDFEMELAAVESRLSGESVGDTSHFRGTDARLAGVSTFEATFGHIRSRGRDFPATRFTYVLEEHDHEHE